MDIAAFIIYLDSFCLAFVHGRLRFNFPEVLIFVSNGTSTTDAFKTGQASTHS